MKEREPRDFKVKLYRLECKPHGVTMMGYVQDTMMKHKQEHQDEFNCLANVRSKTMFQNEADIILNEWGKEHGIEFLTPLEKMQKKWKKWNE